MIAIAVVIFAVKVVLAAIFSKEIIDFMRESRGRWQYWRLQLMSQEVSWCLEVRDAFLQINNFSMAHKWYEWAKDEEKKRRQYLYKILGEPPFDP